MRDDNIRYQEETPEHLIELKEKYERNFLFVKKEQIAEAVKGRYAKFEKVMIPILEKQGIAYSRIEKNKFRQDSSIVMIARVSFLDKDSEDIKLEFLDPFGKGQRVDGIISENISENGVLFVNQMICFEGAYSNETVTIKKIFKRTIFQFIVF